MFSMAMFAVLNGVISFHDSCLTLYPLQALRADIIPKGDVRYNWRGEGPLPYIEKVVEYPPGFQLSFLMQLGPPAPISAMDFTAHWGV